MLVLPHEVHQFRKVRLANIGQGPAAPAAPGQFFHQWPESVLAVPGVLDGSGGQKRFQDSVHRAFSDAQDSSQGGDAEGFLGLPQDLENGHGPIHSRGG